MKIRNYIKIICVTLFIFYINNLNAEIENKIIAKVGREVISSIDLENKIKTLLFINNFEINQKNIDGAKSQAVKTLVDELIKKGEVKRYKVENYSVEELDSYIRKISDSKKLSPRQLKIAFQNNDISYVKFIDSYKTNLLWKTLIFDLYKNQISINTIEVENAIKKVINSEKNFNEYKLSEIELNSGENLANILDLIKKDGFGETAKKISISNSSINRGSIGWVAEQTLSKVYLNELKKIKKGQITKPIKTQGSIIILKIDKIKTINKKSLDLEEVKENIIKQTKNNKLRLFSRSHFSNLENSILVNFL